MIYLDMRTHYGDIQALDSHGPIASPFRHMIEIYRHISATFISYEGSKLHLAFKDVSSAGGSTSIIFATSLKLPETTPSHYNTITCLSFERIYNLPSFSLYCIIQLSDPVHSSMILFTAPVLAFIV